MSYTHNLYDHYYPKENRVRPDICIYHGNCADGFTAAWAVWRRWPDIKFVQGVYGEAPPDVTGMHVLIVDYSYKRDVLLEMGKTAASITVLDHHKTAQEDLAPFSVAWDKLMPFETLAGVPIPIQAFFDMSRSGAMLAWIYCHGDSYIPMLVRIVQDRDLWRFELQGTRAISATIFSYPYAFSIWETLYVDCEGQHSRASLVEQGTAIERKHHKDIRELLALTRRTMKIGGMIVPVANLPYTLASDAGNVMALEDDVPFAACYFDRNDGQRVFSLRSIKGRADVSLVAAAYGGGGHAQAAGFQAPAGWEGE